MARRPRQLADEVQIEWVPMPRSQYFAWLQAMIILDRYLSRAKEIVDAREAETDTLSISQPALAG
jgi:hypothetical protein